MRILLAITSCHPRAPIRQTIRETWLRDLDPARADYRFFIGRPRPSSGPSDEVYLECEDTYAALTSKTHALARWALAAGYDWLFKCDDDTYVRPDRLLSSGFERDDYSGFIGGRWGNLPGSGGREIVYAYAQGGAGYWLSRRALALVADHLLTGEYCEDCAVGKTLALHGIAPIHDARYSPQIGPRELENASARAEFITLHKVQRASMQNLYAADLQGELWTSDSSRPEKFSETCHPTTLGT
jgi:hypothetical protein